MAQIVRLVPAPRTMASSSSTMQVKALVDVERIQRAVLRVRHQNVMLDSDLAALYGVEVKVLEEAGSLRSQTVTLDVGRGRHRKYLPKAFTEQGIAMLSSVLRSPRAVQVNIEIMRAFVQLRRMLGANAELARKLDELEQKYDAQFKAVFQAIRELMAPASPLRKEIGFGRPG